MQTLRRIVLNAENFINIIDLIGLLRYKRASLHRDIVKRRTFRQMLLEHKPKFFLFGKAIYFLFNALPQCNIFNLRYQIIYGCHK